MAGTADETGEPASVCDPPPVEGVDGSISVDEGMAGIPVDPHDVLVFQACTIASTDTDAQTTTLTLACDDGVHALEVVSSSAFGFDTAGDFELGVIQTRTVMGFMDQLVTLRRADGELVLAGGWSPWAPNDPRIQAGFFAPFTIAVEADVCSPEPPDPEDDCEIEQRQALRFTLAGESLDVYDGNATLLSPWALVVGRAVQYLEIECADVPETFYRWVVVPAISD